MPPNSEAIITERPPDEALEPITLPTDRVEALVAALTEEIKALTACQTASVILHAHRVPAERYHAIDAPVTVHREPSGAPTMTLKRVGPLALHCEHRTLTTGSSGATECPDLTRALAEYAAKLASEGGAA